MKKRLTLPLVALAFFSSCASLFAAWTINQPTAGEEFLPTSNIWTRGEAPENTDIVIKLEVYITDRYVTGASKPMSTGPIDPNWQWDFTAPSSGWLVSASWVVNLYQDEDPLLLKASRYYDIISGEA